MNANPEPRYMVDIIRLGWDRAVRIMSRVIYFIQSVKHKMHTRASAQGDNCILCTGQLNIHLKLEKKVEEFWFRREAEIIRDTVPESQLKEYRHPTGGFFFRGRLADTVHFE